MSASGKSMLAGLGLAFVGIFGTTFAVSGLLSPLPLPTGGGTCGPGTGSEAAVIAVFDPVTIGAGPEPPASQAQRHAGWLAFVHSCQTASDQRAAVTLPILVVSLVLVVVGCLLLWRRHRSRTDQPAAGGGGWSPTDGDDAAPGAGWSPAPTFERPVTGAPVVPAPVWIPPQPDVGPAAAPQGPVGFA